MDETEIKVHIDQMVDTVRERGVSDKRILDAMASVRRHIFVHGVDIATAYSDTPLPIGYGQTISQPYTVAAMLEALQLVEGMKVLEIGTGSGWSAALLKRLVGTGKVITIETIAALTKKARENLAKAGVVVDVKTGDGSKGYAKEVPYDRIIVAAACPSVPAALIRQLKQGGILVAPVGTHIQNMIVGTRQGNQLIMRSIGQYRFVPLKGKHGFQ